MPKQLPQTIFGKLNVMEIVVIPPYTPQDLSLLYVRRNRS